jgi:hypothetical protein
MSIRSKLIAAGALTFIAGVLLFIGFETLLAAADAGTASAVRGSLGVWLPELGLRGDLGALSFLLNGGFLLVAAAAALILSRINAPARSTVKLLRPRQIA